jgi:hypothetical protein
MKLNVSPSTDKIGCSGFDEYVIGAPTGKRPWLWTRRILIGISGLLLAIGLLLSFPIWHVLLMKWGDYSGAFMAFEWNIPLGEHEHKVPLGYYPWGQIYYSWAVPAGLLTLSILLFSACLITDQIETEHSNARLAHMPAVFVRPRLKWRSIGMDANGLTAEPPILSIDLFNVGETPAMRLQLRIVDLYVNLRRSTGLFSRHNFMARFEVKSSDREAYYARLVPADHDGQGGASVTENLVRTHKFVIPDPPKNAPGFGRLLQHFLSSSADDDFPALVLVMHVNFETIRGVKFSEEIAVRWSGQTCHAAASPAQRTEVDKLERVVAETTQAGWRAHRPLYVNGRPEDLSSWTWLTLSPQVARVQAGNSLMWGAKPWHSNESGK